MLRKLRRPTSPSQRSRQGQQDPRFRCRERLPSKGEARKEHKGHPLTKLRQGPSARPRRSRRLRQGRQNLQYQLRLPAQKPRQLESGQRHLFTERRHRRRIRFRLRAVRHGFRLPIYQPPMCQRRLLREPFRQSLFHRRPTYQLHFRARICRKSHPQYRSRRFIRQTVQGRYVNVLNGNQQQALREEQLFRPNKGGHGNANGVRVLGSKAVAKVFQDASQPTLSLSKSGTTSYRINYQLPSFPYLYFYLFLFGSVYKCKVRRLLYDRRRVQFLTVSARRKRTEAGDKERESDSSKNGPLPRCSAPSFYQSRLFRHHPIYIALLYPTLFRQFTSANEQYFCRHHQGHHRLSTNAPSHQTLSLLSHHRLHIHLSLLPT